MNSYEKLEGRFRQISRLSDVRSIVQWDEAVMMPSGASASRNDSLAELALVIQNLSTAPEIGMWLEDAQAHSAELNGWQKANLREMKRLYVEQTAIPPELNQKMVLARMNCEQKWRTLRADT